MYLILCLSQGGHKRDFVKQRGGEMFEPLEIIPREELEKRWKRLRDILHKEQPESKGMLLLSRVRIYWASGHFGTGMFWLPLEGEPFLFIRKGIERAKIESMVENIYEYRSFSDVFNLLEEFRTPMPDIISVEMGGTLWSMGKLIEKKFQGRTLLPGDHVVNIASAKKTPWEIEKLKLAGERHFKGICEIVPEKIRVGMSEREIGKVVLDVYLSLGHSGIVRLHGVHEELFIGHISAGDSGIYPTCFNGPVGGRGMHASVPHFGYDGKVWKEGEVLIVDTLFSLEGYHTDKTQVFFAGSKEDMPKEAQKAHEFCLMIQNECAKKLVPGVTCEEIYIFATQQAKKYGFEEGFMGLSKNKVPFIGHGIGLFVNEWPPIARKIKHPLEENMVIALEPKVGIQDFGMVGVENTFLVTPSGGVSMTGDNFDIIFRKL